MLKEELQQIPTHRDEYWLDGIATTIIYPSELLRGRSSLYTVEISCTDENDPEGGFATKIPVLGADLAEMQRQQAISLKAQEQLRSEDFPLRQGTHAWVDLREFLYFDNFNSALRLLNTNNPENTHVQELWEKMMVIGADSEKNFAASMLDHPARSAAAHWFLDHGEAPLALLAANSSFRKDLSERMLPHQLKQAINENDRLTRPVKEYLIHSLAPRQRRV